MTFKAYKKDFGAIVKWQRKHNHTPPLSAYRLAKNSGVSKGLVSKIEQGVANVTIETLFKLAKSMDKDVQDLLPDAKEL